MRVHELLLEAATRLDDAGVLESELDAGLILGHCLGKSRTALYLMALDELEAPIIAQFYGLLQRRQRREPLAYILGVQEFWSLDFEVSPAVLIPRPETELLIEHALTLRRAHPHNIGPILDICTGSGVIAIILAKELGQRVIAVDISWAALQVARKNARKHGVSHLISFVHSDLLSSIRATPYFSLVLSNPPYISSQEMDQGLQREVAEFEPHLALDGGEKGLVLIKRICAQVGPMLLPGADILMEIGTGQGADVLSLFAANVPDGGHYAGLHIEKDYSDHDRIFHAKFNKKSSLTLPR